MSFVFGPSCVPETAKFLHPETPKFPKPLNLTPQTFNAKPYTVHCPKEQDHDKVTEIMEKFEVAPKGEPWAHLWPWGSFKGVYKGYCKGYYKGSIRVL